MTERRDKNNIWIFWIDEDAADLTGVFETDMRPRFAAVDAFVHAVAVGILRPHIGLARADINRVRRGWRYGEGSDRSYLLIVKDRCPCAPRVAGFPDAAADRAEIECIWLSGHAADRVNPSAAKRPDHSPLQSGKAALIELLTI